MQHEWEEMSELKEYCDYCTENIKYMRQLQAENERLLEALKEIHHLPYESLDSEIHKAIDIAREAIKEG